MATRWKKPSHLNGPDPVQPFALDCKMSKKKKSLLCQTTETFVIVLVTNILCCNI